MNTLAYLTRLLYTDMAVYGGVAQLVRALA